MTAWNITSIAFGAIMLTLITWLQWPRKKRTKEDQLISILESMVFLLLHNDSNLIRGMVAENYRGIERATKNDGLADMEITMKGYHASVAHQHEFAQQVKNQRFHGRDE